MSSINLDEIVDYRKLRSHLSQVDIGSQEAIDILCSDAQLPMTLLITNRPLSKFSNLFYVKNQKVNLRFYKILFSYLIHQVHNGFLTQEERDEVKLLSSYVYEMVKIHPDASSDEKEEMRSAILRTFTNDQELISIYG